MGNVAEVLPEKLEAAEAELDALAALLAGMDVPRLQGTAAKGQSAAALEELGAALKTAGEGMASLCRTTRQKITTVRVALTMADRMLAGEDQ